MKTTSICTLLVLLAGIAAADSVTSFTLINADTDADIGTLNHGDTLNLAALPTSNLNVRANTDPATVGSVRFSLDGNANYRTENTAPYALEGDSSGNYNPWTPSLGSHTLTATPYSDSGAGGTAGTALTINFSVVDNPGNLPPTADAGPDKFLMLPTNSVTLSGSGSDTDGTITNYAWQKVSGPAATLSGTNTATLLVSNMLAGTYLFRLTVTDDEGATGYDDASVIVSDGSVTGLVSGELKRWHKVTVTFYGPQTGETATPNPFTDYRLDVTFNHAASAKTYTVPGYYAADGNAPESSATSGNVWRVHFAPDETGTWHYVASFRFGSNIVTNDSAGAGVSAGYFDGGAGEFTIGETDKTGRDFRAKGRLEYVGEHYLRFAGNGEYFLKQGPDAPENFLAYEDFDNTPNNGGRRKSWSAHAGDWAPGDPSWQNGKGTEIIGAVNYLASEGLNVFSFIPMNIAGDDKNVFPYISDAASDRTRIDCSKVDQWEKVFEHADHKGMFLHFKTLETENELILDSGDMGIQRTVYYRELIARFGHHLALNWNLGEEINNASTAQKKSWAQYFYDTDPYHHHIVIHNGANHYDLLGPGSKLTGFSLQTSQTDFGQVHSRVKDYLERSHAAGKPWAVACDEPGDASHALRPDDDAGNSHVDGRKNGIWGTFMAGGWGNEWYFGYQHTDSDLTCQDFRSRDSWWDYCRYALQFFKNNGIPFWEMTNNNDVCSDLNDYCFFKTGEVYVAYLKSGGSATLDLTGQPGFYRLTWFNPRSGVFQGSDAIVPGNTNAAPLGSPPADPGQDWTALVRRLTDDDDYDGDGLPDVWEMTYFSATNVSSGGPTEDWDGDGSSDRDESRTGTSPIDPSSVLALVDLRPDSSGISWVVSWRSEPNKAYAIRTGTNLPEGLTQVLASNIPAFPPTNVHTVSVAQAPTRFFRIVLSD